MKSGVVITPGGGGGGTTDSVARSAASAAQAKADEFKVVETFADLQLLDPSANKYVRTLGYSSVMDGGGATYVAVNEALTDNGGTVVTSDVDGDWRWVIDFEGFPRPEWWGSPGDGTAEDTPYWNSVQASYMGMRLTDGKHYRTNFTISKPGFQLVGSSGTQVSPSVKVSPFNNTLPAITIGDDSVRVYGAAIHNVTFWGDSTYNHGLRLAGGAYQVTINNCYFDKFLGKAVHSEGETNHPTSLVFFNNCWFQRASASTDSTVYIKNLNGPNNWTTKICFDGCHFISSGTSGHLLEVEDVEIYLYGGTHLDCGASGVAIQMTRTGTPYPIINGDWTAIAESGGSATVMTFTGFDPGTSLSTYVKNTFVTGTIVTSGGNMTFPRTLVQAYTHFRYPVCTNVRLADTAQRHNTTSDISNLAEIWAAGTNLYIDHDDATLGGAINLRPKAGQRIILKEVPTVAGGPMEIWSDVSATYITKLLARTATPNSAVSTNPGSVVIAGESGVGKLYLKYTGTGNTGYVDLSSERTITVDTLASMIANVDPVFFKSCIIQGRNSAGDGGGGRFFPVATGGAWSAHASMSPASTFNAGYLWVRVEENTGVPVAAFGAFGATTKSGSDELTVLQNAFTWIESNGGTLSFTRNRYYQVSAALTITNRNGWSLNGNGATIWMANSAANDASHRILRVWDCDDWRIDRLKFDGNKTNRTVPGTPQADHLLVIISCDGWVLDGVEANEGTSDGVYIVADDHSIESDVPRNWTLRNGRYVNNSRQGVSVVNSKSFNISNSYFATNGPNLPASGLDIEANSGAVDGSCSNGVVEGCTFYKNTGTQLQVSGTANSRDIHIRSCFFYGTDSTQSNEIVRMDADHCTMKDCVFREFNSIASGKAVCHITATHNTIEGCSFYGDSAATNWTPGDGIIYFYSASSFSKAIRNKFHNIVMQSGHDKNLIFVHSTNSNVGILENEFYDCILLGSGLAGTIYSAGPDCRIERNKIYQTSATSHRIGIYTTGPRQYIIGNQLFRPHSRGIWMQGDACVARDNKVFDLDSPVAWITTQGGIESWLQGNHMENVNLTATTTISAITIASATNPMAVTDNYAKGIHATNAYTFTGTPRYSNNNITVA